MNMPEDIRRFDLRRPGRCPSVWAVSAEEASRWYNHRYGEGTKPNDFVRTDKRLLDIAPL
jgi:hypothetical protein